MQVDPSLCEALVPASTMPCNLQSCNFCSAQECSGRGTCLLGFCNCNAASYGQTCEVSCGTALLTVPRI